MGCEQAIVGMDKEGKDESSRDDWCEKNLKQSKHSADTSELTCSQANYKIFTCQFCFNSSIFMTGTCLKNSFQIFLRLLGHPDVVYCFCHDVSHS